MSAPAMVRRRGMPLAVLCVMLAAWVTGRAALWESPFPLPDLGAADILFADAANEPRFSADGEGATMEFGAGDAPPQPFASAGWSSPYGSPAPGASWQGYSALRERAAIAAGHQYLMSAAFEADWHSAAFGSGFALDQGPSRASDARNASAPPFAARTAPAGSNAADRWALDVFAYYRAGSASLSTSQGRVPVYGANQIAANLQYRMSPRSGHDPRAFVRAYHALVADPETELAAGLSARPLASVPIRIAGEVRGVRGTAGTDIRPAGYAVAEFAPQSLPLGFSLETYAAAGYVGGEAETYFVDGQGTLTRELANIGGPGDSPMRLSVGGGAWGGAQEDAERLDVGPTMRLDLSVGEVPARVSVDWRQRVAGDAAPDSGVAATVSTRF